MQLPEIIASFVIERLDHVVLRVRDLDRSIAFYGAVLGSASTGAATISAWSTCARAHR